MLEDSVPPPLPPKTLPRHHRPSLTSLTDSTFPPDNIYLTGLVLYRNSDKKRNSYSDSKEVEYCLPEPLTDDSNVEYCLPEPLTDDSNVEYCLQEPLTDDSMDEDEAANRRFSSNPFVKYRDRLCPVDYNTGCGDVRG